MKLLFLFVFISFYNMLLIAEELDKKKLAYIVSNSELPFWKTVSKGVLQKGLEKGYDVKIYNSNNDKTTEMQNVSKVLKENVSGIIISPTDSRMAKSILEFIKYSKTPVVIADIGTSGGEYISYISSDNKKGAYEIGELLVKRLKSLNKANSASVGIIAIPQMRRNAQERTQGFVNAMKKGGVKIAGILKIKEFTYEEMYQYANEFIIKNPDLGAIWIQAAENYNAVFDAIKDANKEKQIEVVAFDALPIFLDLIPEGILLASGMQQPYLMGELAVNIMDDHLNSKEVPKDIKLDILPISKQNIKKNSSIIKRNVFGEINNK